MSRVGIQMTLNLISLHTLTNKMISNINMLGPVGSQRISCQSNATLIVFKHLEGTREFNTNTLKQLPDM